MQDSTIAGTYHGVCGELSQYKGCTQRRGAKADKLVVLKYKNLKLKEGEEGVWSEDYFSVVYGSRVELVSTRKAQGTPVSVRNHP